MPALGVFPVKIGEAIFLHAGGELARLDGPTRSSLVVVQMKGFGIFRVAAQRLKGRGLLQKARSAGTLMLPYSPTHDAPPTSPHSAACRGNGIWDRDSMPQVGPLRHSMPISSPPLEPP